MAAKYEMHVYTMGTRAYAEEVCAAIDPGGKIFGNRILSRDESGSESSHHRSAISARSRWSVRLDAEEPAAAVPVRPVHGRDHRRPRGRLGMEPEPGESRAMYADPCSPHSTRLSV